MTVNRFVSQVVLPNGERLYAICTGDPADRASVRPTPFLAGSAEECQAFLNDRDLARREGYGEGYREGLVRGGELAAKERGKQLQGAFDGAQSANLGECKRRGEEFCDGLLASIKAELLGRGYTEAPKAAAPCRQKEELQQLAAPDGDADDALNGSDLE